MRTGELTSDPRHALWYEIRLGPRKLLEGRYRTLEEAQAYKYVLESDLIAFKPEIVEVTRIDEETDFT